MSWLMGLVPLAAAVASTALLVVVLQWLFRRDARRAAGRVVYRQGITVVVVFLGTIVVIVALPVEVTTRGQLLSLLGILVSAAIALSSTTFLGNMLAGVQLRVVRAFRLGDFVEVEGHFGRITEQGLLHTEIQTEDRDLTTLPNVFLVTHPVKVIRASGTVVSATVSLGYDVPRREVNRLLQAAAEQCGLGEVFVHILDLGDFSVTYRAAGLLAEVKQLLTTRSRLRAMILDALHDAGVEIVSPTFMNTRALRGGELFIPEGLGEDGDGDDVVLPEDVIFDKANAAESLERLREFHLQAEAKLTEIEGRLKSTPKGPERDRLQSRIERLRDGRDELARRIEVVESGLE